MLKTPGALEVVLRFVSLGPSLGGEPETPPIAESTLVRSEVSADMMNELVLEVVNGLDTGSRSGSVRKVMKREREGQNRMRMWDGKCVCV